MHFIHLPAIINKHLLYRAELRPLNGEFIIGFGRGVNVYVHIARDLFQQGRGEGRSVLWTSPRG